jgi:hypothetical protein
MKQQIGKTELVLYLIGTMGFVLTGLICAPWFHDLYWIPMSMSVGSWALLHLVVIAKAILGQSAK